MKKLLALWLAVILLLGLPGCGDTTNTTLKDLQKTGKLTVALSPDCSPYITQNDDGSFSGIEIDLLSVICDELGVLLDVQAVKPGEVLPGIESGKYHLGAGTLSNQSESGSTVLYTNAYAKAPQRLLVKPGTAVPDVQYLAQKVIAVRAGTYAHSYCLSNIISVAVYDTYAEAVDAVLEGTADGLLADEYIARELMTEHNADTTTLALVYDPVATATYAFAMAVGSQVVIDRINLALGDLLMDGTMHAIYDTYGLTYTSPNG